MSADPYILPLCSLDEAREELADTDRQIDRLGYGGVVDAERLRERRVILTRWQTRLRAQVAAMEASDAE